MTARRILAMSCAVVALGAVRPTVEAQQENLRIDGLIAPVEIVTDRWGIAHIYAENEHDLFFAQGYSAVRDRSFQFEMWRRQQPGRWPTYSATGSSRETPVRGYTSFAAIWRLRCGTIIRAVRRSFRPSSTV